MGVHMNTTRLPVLPPPILRRAIRKAAGITQAEIADQVGVSRAAVSRWEEGTRNPRRRHRVRYHVVLSDLSQHSHLPDDMSL